MGAECPIPSHIYDFAAMRYTDDESLMQLFYRSLDVTQGVRAYDLGNFIIYRQ